MNHTCYMKNGSIINAMTDTIIENPAIMVNKADDCLHAWGNLDNVEAKFDKMFCALAKAGNTEITNDLMLIELSKYKINREMACYVLRRATEFTATGFIENLCRELTEGFDPIAWLESEMRRIPIDLTKKEWS